MEGNEGFDHEEPYLVMQVLSCIAPTLTTVRVPNSDGSV